MLDDIVPAIEGVMTALPQPVERPRNPEVKIRLSSLHQYNVASGVGLSTVGCFLMRVNCIDLTQVDALYGAQKDGVWYRVRVERCLFPPPPVSARLWQGRSASNALVRMVDFGWGCTLPIKRWLWVDYF